MTSLSFDRGLNKNDNKKNGPKIENAQRVRDNGIFIKHERLDSAISLKDNISIELPRLSESQKQVLKLKKLGRTKGRFKIGKKIGAMYGISALAHYGSMLAKPAVGALKNKAVSIALKVTKPTYLSSIDL